MSGLAILILGIGGLLLDLIELAVPTLLVEDSPRLEGGGFFNKLNAVDAVIGFLSKQQTAVRQDE